MNIRHVQAFGDSADKNITETTVRLRYADHDDASEATEWLEAQVTIDANYERALAEVERDALLKLQQTINERIRVLRQLAHPLP